MLALESNLNSLHIGSHGVPISPELEPNKKMYNPMEPILQEVQKIISLPDEERSSHNKVVHKVVDEIIEQMKQVDPLFNAIFNKTLYGGSYFDGLKLNSADEYDLDLALKLHKKLNATIEKSDIEGFVRIRVDLDAMKSEINYKDYRALEKMVDSNKYIITSEFRAWFEGVVYKAKTSLNAKGNQFKLRKSGPAFTAIIQIGNKEVSVDLVPAFIFSKKTDWPPAPFKRNPTTTKDEFLVVPKDPPSSIKLNNSWRLSFQEQEKEIINGKNGLKDTIRLLKQLRSRQFHDNALASYFIKTVMMWFKDSVDETFWSNSRSYIFMMGLKYFHKLLRLEKIPYYWNENYNLLRAVNKITISNWSNRLDRIIKSLEKNLSSSSDDLRKCLLGHLGLDNNKDEVQNQQGVAVGQVQQDEEGQSQLVMLTAETMVAYDCESPGKVAAPEKEIVQRTDSCIWKSFSEFEAIGVNVTRKMEKMDKVQAVYAEKLISDILRMGFFEKLTDATSVMDGKKSEDSIADATNLRDEKQTRDLNTDATNITDEKKTEDSITLSKKEKRLKSGSLEDFDII